MGIILPFFVALNIFICTGFLLPWQQEIPMQEVVGHEVQEGETIQDIYNAGLKLSSFFVPEVHRKRYEMSYSGGKNCGRGKEQEAVYVDNVGLPDVLYLGGNATFSASVTVNREVKTANLLTVVLQKAGIPGDIPCTGNIGSCNYTEPCNLLEKVECPKKIIAQGWNCRCPIPKNTYVVPDETVTLPTVPLPAFLVDGQYDAKVQLFDADEELLCYRIQVTVKEK